MFKDKKTRKYIVWIVFLLTFSFASLVSASEFASFSKDIEEVETMDEIEQTMDLFPKDLLMEELKRDDERQTVEPVTEIWRTEDLLTSPSLTPFGVGDINIGSGSTLFPVPMPSQSIYDPEAISNPIYKGFTQSDQATKALEIQSDTKLRLANKDVSTVLAGSRRVSDGFILTYRIVHKNLSGGKGGGYLAVKTDFKGNVLNHWASLDRYDMARQSEGTLVGPSSGGVYSFASLTNSFEDNTSHIFLGFDPKVTPNSNNIWTTRKLVDGTSVINNEIPNSYVHEMMTIPSVDGNSLLMTSLLNYSRDSQWKGVRNLYFGDVAFNSSETGVEIKNKGVIQIVNWNVIDDMTPGMIHDSNYQTVIPRYITKMDNGGYIALLNYGSNFTNKAPMVETIQTFDKNGVRIKSYIPTELSLANGTGSYQNTYIGSSGGKHYIFLDDMKKSYVVEYNEHTGAYTTIQEFPAETTLNFKEVDGINYYVGSTPSLTKAFSGFQSNESGPYTVSGVAGPMDSNNPFEIESLKAVNAGLTTKGEISEFYIDDIHVLSGNDIFVTGSSDNQKFGKNASISNTAVSDYLMGFWGPEKINADYSPLIKANIESHVVNLDDMTSNVTQKNKLLLKDKDGNPVISVIDREASLVYGDEWIKERLNLNPLSLNTPIEWNTLGFKDKMGTQKVRYFAADDQMQSSSVEVLVNGVRNSTNYNTDKTMFLDVDNFAIGTDKVASLTANSTKKLADSKAWKVSADNPTYKFAEDSSNALYSNNVSVNTTQLNAIKAATTPDKAKPYPLDITYKDKINTVDTTIKKRIWVFVTKDNTTVTDDYVMYADDFSILLTEAKAATDTTVLKKQPQDNTEPNVVVYNFKDKNQTATNLPALSTGKTDGTTKGLSIEPSSLSAMKSATGAKIIPDYKFNYKDSKNVITSVLVKATVLDDSAKVTVRYRDDKGTEILADKTIDGYVGSNYNATTEAYKVDIPGYILDDDNLPTNGTGTFTKNEIFVDYVYLKHGTISFLNERNGDELKIVEFKKTEPLDKRYQSLVVRYPKNSEIKPITLPSGWSRIDNASINNMKSTTYKFGGKSNGAVLEKFINDIRFGITSSVDEESQVELLLRVKDNASGTDDVTFKADTPQKIYVKGKSEKGKILTQGDVLLDSNLRIGTTAKYTQKTVPGYNFKQLEDLSSNKITNYNLAVKKTAQTYNAIYTGNSTVTVSYVDQEGKPIATDKNQTITGEPTDNYDVSGQSFRPTIPGYRFDEAPTNITGKFTVDPIEVKYVYMKQWEVTYNSNGGTPNPPTEMVDTKKKATKPSSEPTKTNHKFSGWYSDAALTKEWDFDDEVEADMTLYAKWSIGTKVIVKHVDRDDNNINVKPQDEIIGHEGDPYDASIYITPITNYKLVPNQKPDKEKGTMTKETITVTYEYIRLWKVTFDSKGGSSVPTQENIENKALATEPPNPTKSGYTFDGWYDSEEYTTKMNFATQITKDYNLVAKWRSSVVDPSDGKTPVTPIDPTTGNDKPQNSTEEDLRIQYISDFDFGTQKISTDEQRYASKADYVKTSGNTKKWVSPFISVIDDRPVKAKQTPWTLSVERSDLKDINSTHEVKGARLLFSNVTYQGTLLKKPVVPVPDVEIPLKGQAINISSSGQNLGDGSWSLSLGKVSSTDKSTVNLLIPQDTGRKTSTYTTIIDWNLVSGGL